MSTKVSTRLLRTRGPAHDEVREELVSLSELREKPGRTIHIGGVEHGVNAIVWPGRAVCCAAA